MKKNVKEITLFDNYNVSEDFDEEKKGLQECNPDMEITDEMVWESLSDCERDEWDACKDTLHDIFGDNNVIAMGKAGTWRGRFECGRLFGDIDKAVSACIKDCDNIKVVQLGNGIVEITSSHHDGTNTFEIKGITERGRYVYDSWVYNDKSTIANLREYQVLEKIWKSNLFSKYAKFAV
jgi:hypothetical protein